MIVASFRHLARWYQRRQFVREVYRQLFAVEVEREYFRNHYSYFVADTFNDQIDVLQQFLTAAEKERYEVYWKQEALQIFLVEIEDKIPEYIRDHLMEDKHRFKYLDLKELIAYYCRIHKCKDSLMNMLKRL